MSSWKPDSLLLASSSTCWRAYSLDLDLSDGFHADVVEMVCIHVIGGTKGVWYIPCFSTVQLCRLFACFALEATLDEIAFRCLLYGVIAPLPSFSQQRRWNSRSGFTSCLSGCTKGVFMAANAPNLAPDDPLHSLRLTRPPASSSLSLLWIKHASDDQQSQSILPTGKLLLKA